MIKVAPHVCAVCGGDIWESPPRTAQLGEGDAFVAICTRCDSETPQELRGPARDRLERGYAGGSGAAPKAGEFAEATRRVVGDERYAAESERLRKDGQRPVPAMNPADVDYQKYVYQGVRERATRKGDGKVSARASARRDIARKVKRKKARNTQSDRKA